MFLQVFRCLHAHRGRQEGRPGQGQARHQKDRGTAMALHSDHLQRLLDLPEVLFSLPDVSVHLLLCDDMLFRGQDDDQFVRDAALANAAHLNQAGRHLAQTTPCLLDPRLSAVLRVVSPVTSTSPKKSGDLTIGPRRNVLLVARRNKYMYM